MVAALPTDPSAPLRAWVAPGSPCVSVYLPVFPPQEGRSGAVAVELADEGVWRQVDVLRRRCEDDAAALAPIRAVLDPVEAELWDLADEVATTPGRWHRAITDGARLFADRLARLCG